LNGCRIELLGQDILADIDDKSIKGMMKEGTSVTDSIKNAVESACPGSTCKVDLQSPEKGKVRYSAPASSLYSFINRSAAMCKTEQPQGLGGSKLFKQMDAEIKGAAKGATVSSAAYIPASNKFIWSGKKEPEVGKDTGGRGEKSGGGDKKKDTSKDATYDYATHSSKNHVDNNRGENATNSTIQSAVRGELKMVWYPSLRAKKCISIVNVGSEASGDWYVSSAIHTWSVGHGGMSAAHLMRNDPQDEQDSKDKPGKAVGKAAQQGTNPGGAP
jgi:hypothetical protein